MKEFVRDSTVRIAVTFYDADGAVVTPTSATVAISYQKNGCYQTDTFDLTQSGDEWRYNWDSREADAGVVSCHAITGGDAPFSSVDFEFRLTANKANRCA